MKPLILGLGQDSALLAKQFDSLNIDYQILARRSSGSIAKSHSLQLPKQRILFVTEINESEMLRLRQSFEFTHIYNFAANSFVQDSHLNFDYFINSNSRILWEIFKLKYHVSDLWVFHPLSSEILDADCPITENSCGISPRNAYGTAKAMDYYTCKIANNEEDFSINYCILFNHESKLRPQQFFTKKVINAFQTRSSKKPNELAIYNTQSKRDWGAASEFMRIISDAGNDKITGQSVLGTGCLMSVEDFIDNCFYIENIDFEKTKENGLLKWSSSTVNIFENGRDEHDEKRIVSAPVEVVKNKFGVVPRVWGTELIKGLLNGDF
jgi:GDPmannose 4,6-dehydratase